MLSPPPTAMTLLKRHRAARHKTVMHLRLGCFEGQHSRDQGNVFINPSGLSMSDPASAFVSLATTRIPSVWVSNNGSWVYGRDQAAQVRQRYPPEGDHVEGDDLLSLPARSFAVGEEGDYVFDQCCDEVACICSLIKFLPLPPVDPSVSSPTSPYSRSSQSPPSSYHRHQFLLLVALEPLLFRVGTAFRLQA